MRTYHLILGSQSPRREELIRRMGLDVDIKAIPIDESYPSDLPTQTVAEYIAKEKALAFDFKVLPPHSLVITCDTVVAVDNEIMGKPKDAQDAEQMLKKISGRKHQVISGVCLRTETEMDSFSVTTDVFFRVLKDEEINYYISNYKPFDKAGAYGIQEWIGCIGVERIEGSYYNVMGLPTQTLYNRLMKMMQPS